jgi:hypothetical protein
MCDLRIFWGFGIWGLSIGFEHCVGAFEHWGIFRATASDAALAGPARTQRALQAELMPANGCTALGHDLEREIRPGAPGFLHRTLAT